MKPVAVQLYSLREEAKKDLAGVLSQVARIGYNGVELAGLYNRPAKEVRKMLDDVGLSAPSAHVAIPTKENLNELVEMAGTMGCKFLVCNKGPDGFATADAVKATAAALRQGAELLKPHGLTMGYHNHWWEFVNVDGGLAYDVLMASAKGLIAEIDVYWARNFGANDVPALIRKYVERIPLLHLKDGPLVEKQPHVAVGSGKMDIPACVAAADPKVLQWLVVELDSCATDMIAAVRDSYTYLVGKGLTAGKA